MKIRLATENDNIDLLKIYEQYIETPITFEYKLPTEEEFKARIKNITKEYPYIVCEEDNKIVGYAYANKFKDREAYSWDAELSIYIDKYYTSKGIGKKFYKILIEILKLQGIKNIYGCVTIPNEKSEKLHKSLGFKMSGVFANTGYKCGNWQDVAYFEKIVGEHDINPTQFIVIDKIEKEKLTKIIEKYINEKVFEKANFNGQKLIVEKCAYFPRLDGIVFSPYTKFILKDINYSKKNCLCGKNNYKIARIQAKQTEDNENMSYYYYNERNYTSNFLKSSRYKGYSDYLTNEFFDFLSKYIIGYGEKPFRLLCISVFIISLFALIYMFTGLNTMDYGLVKINLSKNMYTFNEIIIYYLEAWYFSMITFSTVGYGEIIALGIFGKIFVCLEVFLGITVHATWTSVLFSRLIQ